MKFEWDNHKRELNLRKHGFDFSDAKHVFQGFRTVKLLNYAFGRAYNVDDIP